MPRKGSCKVCQSPVVEEINQALASGQSPESVQDLALARGYRHSADSLRRHQTHVTNKVGTEQPVGSTAVTLIPTPDAVDLLLRRAQEAVATHGEADTIIRAGLEAVIGAGIARLAAGTTLVTPAHLLTALQLYAGRYGEQAGEHLDALRAVMGISITVNVPSRGIANEQQQPIVLDST